MINGAVLYIKKGTRFMGVQIEILMGILNFYSFIGSSGVERPIELTGLVSPVTTSHWCSAALLPALAWLRPGSLLLLMWSVKILQILVQVERRGVNACNHDTATSNFFGDNQVFHELTKVTEQATKHTEVTRLRLEVHGCRYEVYIFYSLLFYHL